MDLLLKLIINAVLGVYSERFFSNGNYRWGDDA